VSTLQKERARRAQRSLDTQRALYRGELRQAAAERGTAVAQAEDSARRIAELLPGALQAGISVVEAAELTEISRPTLYRMLGHARQRQDLRGLAIQFEHALERLAGDLDRPALPPDLAAHFHQPLDDVFESLMQLYQPLAREVTMLGPGGLTALVDLLPDLGVPEKIVLNMLLLQRLPLEDVAVSTKFSQTRVAGWAALGLLRVLPHLRKRAAAPLFA